MNKKELYKLFLEILKYAQKGYFIFQDDLLGLMDCRNFIVYSNAKKNGYFDDLRENVVHVIVKNGKEKCYWAIKDGEKEINEGEWLDESYIKITDDDKILELEIMWLLALEEMKWGGSVVKISLTKDK